MWWGINLLSENWFIPPIECPENTFSSACTPCPPCDRGECDAGVEGSGLCFCDVGWTGELCDGRVRRTTRVWTASGATVSSWRMIWARARCVGSGTRAPTAGSAPRAFWRRRTRSGCAATSVCRATGAWPAPLARTARRRILGASAVRILCPRPRSRRAGSVVPTTTSARVVTAGATAGRTGACVTRTRTAWTSAWVARAGWNSRCRTARASVRGWGTRVLTALVARTSTGINSASICAGTVRARPR